MSDLFAAPEPRFPPPRAFQTHAIAQLRAGFSAGHRAQILMAPTGAGKTYLGLSMCQSALEKGGRVLFICDRKTLIDQTSSVATGYGMPRHGIIQASNPRFDLSRRFQIASAQTMAARGFSDDYGPRDVVVIDEAHTLHETVSKFVTETQAACIGLSATPFTKGLGKLYQGLVNAATMHELTTQGVLTPLRIMSCARPDMTDAKTSGGEWTASGAAERGMAIIGDVVTEWMKHGEGRKTICFGSTVDHCEALLKQFTEAGVAAALFTGKTPDAERQRLLEEYRRPSSRLRILISVEALAKGFDVPDVSCVIDARPLRKSLSTFVQLVGRGLRSAPGKEDCILLDHSGNVVRFAEDFSRVFFEGLAALDDGERLDKEVRKEPREFEGRPCPQCGFTPFARRCIACGFEVAKAPTVAHEPGVARLYDLLGDKGRPLAAMRRELWEMLATHEMSKFKRRGTGNPQGATAHRYRELMGTWPPRDWQVLDAPRRVATRELQGKLRSMEIAWARSKARAS